MQILSNFDVFTLIFYMQKSLNLHCNTCHGALWSNILQEMEMDQTKSKETTGHSGNSRKSWSARELV